MPARCRDVIVRAGREESRSRVSVVTHRASKEAEARRLVLSGGVYLNNRRVTDPAYKVGREQAIQGEVLVLRKGQKQNHLVRLT